MASSSVPCVRKTRQMLTEDFIFGVPGEFNENQLPTYENIMKEYLYYKQMNEIAPCNLRKQFLDHIIPKLNRIWLRASIPMVSYRRIEVIITDYHVKYKNLLKNKRISSPVYMERINVFKEDSKKLLDLASCKCVDFSKCNCPRIAKVPIEERPFLTDQRTTRKLFISTIDKERTRKNINKHVRNISRSRSPKNAEQHPRSNQRKETLSDSRTLQTEASKPETIQMRVNLSNLALEWDRYGVSDRSAAAIATATLQDFGIVRKDDCTNVIDKNKLRRERKNVRRELQAHSREISIQSIYFDGRKDVTIGHEKIGTKWHSVKKTEEHVVIVEEPGGKYIGHITPPSSHAISIANELFSFLHENQIETENLTVIGCDGTNVNVGVNGGVIRIIEERLNRHLQWFVCLLHCNELLLRHLFVHLDGVTSGPTSFSGVIGKAIQTCDNLPITNFTKIRFLPPDGIVLTDLSTDQQLLLDMCIGIDSGEISNDLKWKKPGPVAHSRWLTTGIRILRLYVSTAFPTIELKYLAEFTIKVYSTMWFTIKCESTCRHGSKHFFKMVQSTRYLPTNLRQIIDKVIQRNAFFAHKENILLCMICDDRSHIRELAYRRILQSRDTFGRSQSLRKFELPKLQFGATDYFDLIYWNYTPKCEPPLTMQIETEDIITSLENKEQFPLLDFIKFPCHTQSVERAIKLVTEASLVVCGEKERDGFIRARMLSRQLRKHFENKSQYLKSVQ